VPSFRNKAPAGEHDIIGRVCRDDREQLRGRRVVCRLEKSLLLIPVRLGSSELLYIFRYAGCGALGS